MENNINKLKNSKKGFSIQDMSSIGITLVVTAIVVGIGATILSSIQNTQTVGSVAYNSSGYGLTGLQTLSSYMPTIALVAVAAVVIGIILVFFTQGGGKK